MAVREARRGAGAEPELSPSGAPVERDAKADRQFDSVYRPAGP